MIADHTNLFSQLIARTAKDIEQLIDSLPSEESSADLQASSLKKLETENQEAADKLVEVSIYFSNFHPTVIPHNLKQSKFENFYCRRLRKERPY